MTTSVYTNRVLWLSRLRGTFCWFFLFNPYVYLPALPCGPFKDCLAHCTMSRNEGYNFVNTKYRSQLESVFTLPGRKLRQKALVCPRWAAIVNNSRLQWAVLRASRFIKSNMKCHQQRGCEKILSIPCIKIASSFVGLLNWSGSTYQLSNFKGGLPLL